jgi:hypothetical protein
MNVIRRMNESVEVLRKMVETTPTKLAAALYYELRTTQSKVEIWKEAGAKTFILRPELIEAFQNTDIPLDAFPLDFQYPFDSFMIESDIPLFYTTSESGSKPVHNILYVSKKEVDKVQDRIITVNPDYTKGGTIQWGRTITAFFSTEDFIECIFIYLNDGESIKSNLTIKKKHLALVELEESDARSMLNILYNTIMYVNDPDRDRQATEVAGSRKVNIGNDGGSIRTSYITLHPPKNYKPLSESAGKTLDSRFIVRGHWRNQAFGEKFSQHKHIWIHPYYKGPELAEVINKPYLVK